MMKDLKQIKKGLRPFALVLVGSWASATSALSSPSQSGDAVFGPNRPEFSTTMDAYQIEAIFKKHLYSRKYGQRSQSRFKDSNDYYRLAEHLLRVCEFFNIEPELALAFISTESSFNTHAYSKAKARGLMQLLYPTARAMARKHGIQGMRNPQDLFNPFINVTLGVAYLRHLKNRFSNLNHFIAAYNLGPGTVSKRIRRQTFYPMGAISDYVIKIRKRTASVRQEGQRLVLLAQN